MSKVKNHMDSNKEKARHRNRIDETRRTKANRIRKCNNWTYNWLRGGYYHVTEHETYRYMYIQNKPIVIYKTDWDHYFETGEKITHKVIGIYPIYKEKVEIRIKPVSILKRGSTKKRILKTFASRRFRRGINTSEEDYYLPKGNTYKRVTNNKWLCW